MARPKEKKDKTSIAISVILHVLLIGAIAYWAYKTGKLEQIRQAMLQYVRSDKKQEKQQPVQQKAPPPASKLPPINQGMPPKESGGTRRAVAADAPAATGDTFFQDTRKQVQGPGGAGGSSQTKTQETKVVVVPPPPPRPAMKAAAPTTIKKLLEERQKEAAAVESFGSEQISKSGVSDAGDIVNKVAGASVVDGKFAVIRGLSDRYVTTTLNGSEIPSPDPYRRSASLDMFPAQVISKVVVSKTFTPDQPGSYTGGGVNIVTKSFPERAFVSMSIGVGYNTQATGNERFLTYDGGNLDWLGMDDGTRALPDRLALPDPDIPDTAYPSARPSNDDYEERVRSATRLNRLTRLLGSSSFAPEEDDPTLNHNFSLAAGETTHLFGKPLGVFGSLNYKRDFSYYEDGIARAITPNLLDPGEVELRKDYTDRRSTDEVNWAAMANLAYQLHENHQLQFNFLHNQNSEKIARIQVGEHPLEEPDRIFYRNRLHFTERSLQTFQLSGAHTLPEVRSVKLDWLAALSNTAQEEPDVHFLNYQQFDTNYFIGHPANPEPRLPTRYFRNLKEENQNYKVDFTIPFNQSDESDGHLKLGWFRSGSDRTYLDREFYYQEGIATPPFNGDPRTVIAPEFLGSDIEIDGDRIRWHWKRYLQMRESAYNGEYQVQAGYWMVDMPISSSVRVIGGLRAETTAIDIFSRSYQASSVSGLTTNITALDEVDLLPSAGIVMGITKNMNVRLAYSQTIARPSFRELAAVRSYDPVLDEVVEGNPSLGMVDSDNLDLRWEWFFGAGELISFSAFYKELMNPIEKQAVRTDGEIVTFVNRESATVMGLEFEVRKTLGFLSLHLENFSLGGNLSLIKSEVSLSDEEWATKQNVPDAERDRALFDQSPYILNVDLSYDNPRSGTSSSLIFNIAGPRLNTAFLNTWDVYEQPAPMLDFIISQKLGRHLAIKFAARNLLDPTFERTYGEDKIDIYRSFTKGITFSVGLNYEF